MARVLILHGWTNRRPVGHWQRALAGELREQGHLVSYTQMPNPDVPQLGDWLEIVSAELQMLREVGERSAEELIVIAHSLGCITFLQAAAQGLLEEIPSRLLLVAPPERQPVTLPEFETFVMKQSDEEIRAISKKAANSLTLVGSDADVWQPSGIQAGVGDMLGVEAVLVVGAKHFSHHDGFHHWQGVINWVNDPSADLTRV